MDSVDEGLRALIARGFRFQHLKDTDGNVAAVIGSFGWPEYYDRIHVYSETEATAARAVMNTRPGADKVVWSYQGPAITTIHELLTLPKPHEPGAPRLTRRASLGLWLPGTGQ